MASFYIEKLVASGPGKETSSIDFCDGLNIIVGPSNTGKSLIAYSIDYIFGFTQGKNDPFLFDKSFGYDLITLHVITPHGTVVFQRKFEENAIRVMGTDPNIVNGEYKANNSSPKNVGSVFMQMIGVDESHKILKNQNGDTLNLYWRSFLHMFFIKQEHVARPTPVLFNPKKVPNMASTSSKAAALFLMSGNDANDYVAGEDKKIRKAKRAAVIEYIRNTVIKYTERENELNEAKERFLSNNPDFVDEGSGTYDNEIDRIANEIESVQVHINSNIDMSQKLMHDIYLENSRLAESSTVSERFGVLRSQYQSDIKRLTFIIEGGMASSNLPKRDHCPFCESEISVKKGSSYITATRAELDHIRVHLKELDKAERDIKLGEKAIESKVIELEEKKRTIDLEIKSELVPLLNSLKEKFHLFKSFVELNNELDIIKREERGFSSDLFEKETAEDPPETKYDINTFFERSKIDVFEEKLVTILRSCNYQGANSAHFNIDTFDLEVGGREKATANGGGYCGFLNTIVALAFLEFLEEDGVYSPGFLIVDSPLTQLSESEYREDDNSLVTGLLDYLINIYKDDSELENTSAEQIIIMEHKDRMPMLRETIGDAKHVKVTEFTHDKNHGRYGFLNDVCDQEK